jgi:hypothetical protein
MPTAEDLEALEEMLAVIGELEPHAGRSVHLGNLLERARRVCEALMRGEEAIPAVSQQQERARQARRDRDATLRLMAYMRLRGLAEWFGKDCDHDHLLGPFEAQADGAALRKLMRNMALKLTGPRPPVLTPAHEYALSPNAVPFFEVRLRLVLHCLEALHRAAYEMLAPDRYDGTSWDSVRDWSEAWSASVTAIVTNWLIEQGEYALVGIARALLFGPLAQFRAISGRALPSNDHAVRVGLNLDPVLCQTLTFDPRHWAVASGDYRYSTVTLSMRSLSYEAMLDERHYRGLCIAHLHLAVWIERLPLVLTALAEHENRQAGESRTTIDHPRQIAPGQHALTKMLLKRARFARKHEELTTRQLLRREWPSELDAWCDRSGTAGTGVDVVDRVRTITAPAADPECIGAVELPWQLDRTNESAQWIDLTLFVHRDGHRQKLITETEPHDEHPEYVWVRVSSDQCPPAVVDELRRSLPRARWARKVQGLGVFFFGAIDLDI